MKINGKPGIVCIIADKQNMGKSTLANYLVEKHRFVRVSIADPLKKSLITILRPVLGERRAQRFVWEAKDEVIPELRVTARELLVGGGNGYCGVCPDIFLRVAMSQSRAYNESGLNVVVDDVRKTYEAHGFSTDGAFFIRVVRPANDVEPSPFEGQLNGYPAHEMLIDSEPGDHTLMYHLADTLMKGLDYDPD